MRRFAELGAMSITEDGVIGLAALRRHGLLRKFGPEGYKRVVEGFAERPALVRLPTAAEVGGCLCFASRQYRDG